MYFLNLATKVKRLVTKDELSVALVTPWLQFPSVLLFIIACLCEQAVLATAAAVLLQVRISTQQRRIFRELPGDVSVDRNRPGAVSLPRTRVVRGQNVTDERRRGEKARAAGKEDASSSATRAYPCTHSLTHARTRTHVTDLPNTCTHACMHAHTYLLTQSHTRTLSHFPRFCARTCGLTRVRANVLTPVCTHGHTNCAHSIIYERARTHLRTHKCALSHFRTRTCTRIRTRARTHSLAQALLTVSRKFTVEQTIPVIGLWC